jgi:hypothetical protein
MFELCYKIPRLHKPRSWRGAGGLWVRACKRGGAHDP